METHPSTVEQQQQRQQQQQPSSSTSSSTSVGTYGNDFGAESFSGQPSGPPPGPQKFSKPRTSPVKPSPSKKIRTEAKMKFPTAKSTHNRPASGIRKTPQLVQNLQASRSKFLHGASACTPPLSFDHDSSLSRPSSSWLPHEPLSPQPTACPTLRRCCPSPGLTAKCRKLTHFPQSLPSMASSSTSMPVPSDSSSPSREKPLRDQDTPPSPRPKSLGCNISPWLRTPFLLMRIMSLLGLRLRITVLIPRGGKRLRLKLTRNTPGMMSGQAL